MACEAFTHKHHEEKSQVVPKSSLDADSKALLEKTEKAARDAAKCGGVCHPVITNFFSSSKSSEKTKKVTHKGKDTQGNDVTTETQEPTGDYDVTAIADVEWNCQPGAVESP